MANTLIKIVVLLLGLAIGRLAWDGNLGKGLAAIIAPWSLKVDVHANTGQNADQTGVS